MDGWRERRRAQLRLDRVETPTPASGCHSWPAGNSGRHPWFSVANWSRTWPSQACKRAFASKWVVLGKQVLTENRLRLSWPELRGCNGDAIYVLPEYRDHSPGVQSGHSKTTVSFCLYLCIAALSLKVAMLPGAWSSSVLEVCIKNCAQLRLQISSRLILKWSWYRLPLWQTSAHSVSGLLLCTVYQRGCRPRGMQ